MMVHEAEQIPMQDGESRGPRRTAWPDFVPEEMAERFINENQQVEKVVAAELEQIDEEEKKEGVVNSVADDGRLAW